MTDDHALVPPRLRVLGPVTVGPDERTLGSPLLRRLLAALLVHAGSVVSVDRLADIIWADAPPANIHNALQSLVSRLRAALRAAGVAAGGGDTPLRTHSPGYLMAAQPGDVDAQRFERLVDAARSAPAERAADLLGAALELWRGPAYAEFADAMFARAEAVRLEELRAAARGDLADALLTVGRVDEAVTLLDMLTVDHPLSERPHAQLMRALHRSGRTPDALAVFRQLQARLDDELGLEPSAGLQDLHTRLLRGDTDLTAAAARPHPATPRPATAARAPRSGGTPATAPAAADDAAAPATATGVPGAAVGAAPGPTDQRPAAAARPGNLRAALVDLIGREDTIGAVAGRLTSARLLTLTGPGGVGKTSLALAVAHATAGRYRDGVWVFELAGIDRPEDVADLVTTTLDLPQQDTTSPLHRITTALHGLAALVVVDNCEHVIGGAAVVVDALVRSCPDITVLATSRQPLGVAGERIWPVPTLDVADVTRDGAPGESAAVRLFTERAIAAAPAFALTDANAADVRELCRRLDGLPLAIELAAMRMPAMTAAEVVAQLPARLRFLRSTSRLAERRHQTLRAVIDWSYDALDPEEQRLFEVVSVFAGSFTAAAAEHVAGHDGRDPTPTLDLLARLVDKSLVFARPGAPATRYFLLETLREYGQQRLAEAGGLHHARQAHARYWVAFAQDMAARLFTRDQNDATDAIAREMGELRSAHVWALEHDLPLALRMMPALIGYAELRMPPELFTWAQRTVALAGQRGLATADVATGHAVIAAGARVSGDLAAARHHAERALAISGPGTAFAHHHALYLLTDVALFEGRLADIHTLEQRRRALPDVPDGRWIAMQARINEALAYAYAGDTDAALAVAETVRAAATDEDAPVVHAYVLFAVGEALMEHAPDRARERMHTALALAREGRDRLVLGVIMVSAASLHLRMDEPREAVALFREAVAHWRQLGVRTMLWVTLRNVVALLSTLDATADAATLLGVVTTRTTAAPIYGADQERLDAVERVLRARLGADGFLLRREAGARMDDDEGMRFVADALARIDG